MSHREMETTEGYQYKALVATKAPSVRGAMEVVCQLYLSLYAQSIYLKSY
ncbi:hypothetical protein [Prevotella jejuni]|nr:hypothetical protein [Prevotella jejuni]